MTTCPPDRRLVPPDVRQTAAVSLPSSRAGRPLLAVGAGVVLYLGFPPADLWPMAVVGVALLTLLVRGRKARSGALLGLLAGLGQFVPLLHWSGAIAGPAAWLGLALLEALFFLPLGAALALVTRLPGWPLWTALVWVSQEALRDRVPFGGFPWGRLAFSQGGSPLTPLAALGGAPLVSFAVAGLGAAAASLLVGQRRWAVPALALALLAAAVPVPTGGVPTTVALVQGNVPRLGLDFSAQRAAVLTNHVTATHQLAAQVRAGRAPRPDLVIWPENASDLDPYTDPAARRAIDGAVKDIGVPTLVGALTDGPGRFLSNRGIAWDPATGPGESYVKRHPVPFGEYIPFRSLARQVSSRVDLVARDFARGSRVGLLRLGGVTIGDVICFEVAYDSLVRDVVTAGGTLVVVQTNNATFGRSPETTQQLAMSRLRAVEHGRTVLVAATSGLSAVIAPDGRVLERSRVFTRRLLVQRVPRRTALTVADRLGPLPEVLLTLGGLLVTVVAARRRRTAVS